MVSYISDPLSWSDQPEGSGFGMTRRCGETSQCQQNIAAEPVRVTHRPVPLGVCAFFRTANWWRSVRHDLDMHPTDNWLRPHWRWGHPLHYAMMDRLLASQRQPLSMKQRTLRTPYNIQKLWSSLENSKEIPWSHHLLTLTAKHACVQKNSDSENFGASIHRDTQIPRKYCNRTTSVSQPSMLAWPPSQRTWPRNQIRLLELRHESKEMTSLQRTWPRNINTKIRLLESRREGTWLAHTLTKHIYIQSKGHDQGIAHCKSGFLLEGTWPAYTVSPKGMIKK